MTSEKLEKIVIFGGTGAQGGSVVKALCADGHYLVSVLTRDVSTSNAKRLEETYPVRLIEGSYTTEEGLRAAFVGQDVCYFSIDSFTTGEPEEYFWTFRAYEIAVQAGLKLFIFSGSGPTDRFDKYGYDERYRNCHNIVSARLSGWLASQPLKRLPWVIVYGGVYAEMLARLLRPIRKDDGHLEFQVPMHKDSVMPLTPLEMYGMRVLWALHNPVASVGRFLPCGTYDVTFPEIAQALQDASMLPTSFREISVDAWMESVRQLGIDPNGTLPHGSTGQDPTRFTWRKSFGAWWALWRDNRGSLQDEPTSTAWADSVYPSRPHTLQEWMGSSGYLDALGTNRWLTNYQ